MNIRIKRIYEDPAKSDGFRVLVDRLWPRGVSKADAAVHRWEKALAPSDKLRKAFGHDPEKFSDFIRDYRKELKAVTDTGKEVLAAAPSKTITLLYAAKDTEHNNAVVLKSWLEELAQK